MGGGASGGPSGSSAQSAYPGQLLATWQGGEGEGADSALKFNADGTCVQKDVGSLSDPCTYSVSTGGVDSPSTSQSWIVQVSGTKYDQSLEIVAIDKNQITARDGTKLYGYVRVSDDAVKDCVGTTPQTCDELAKKQTCENTAGCSWDWYGDAYYCDGDVIPCLSHYAEDCNTYPACHLQ